jgi:hypothetical protein
VNPADIEIVRPGKENIQKNPLRIKTDPNPFEEFDRVVRGGGEDEDTGGCSSSNTRNPLSELDNVVTDGEGRRHGAGSSKTPHYVSELNSIGATGDPSTVAPHHVSELDRSRIAADGGRNASSQNPGEATTAKGKNKTEVGFICLVLVRLLQQIMLYPYVCFLILF